MLMPDCRNVLLAARLPRGSAARAPLAVLAQRAGLALSTLMMCQASLADTCDVPDINAEYQLVFEDDFDGNELDRTRWNTEFLWGPGVIINNELQYYVNDGQFGVDPFEVSNGLLTISADRAPFDRSLLYLTRSIYSATTAELLWRTPEGATQYEVWRDNELLGVAQGGSWFDPSLRAGIDHAYEVIALDANGNRLVAAQLTVNTADRPVSVPAQPFSLGLRSQVYGPGTAEIVWDTPNRARRYRIDRDEQPYRDLPGGDFSSLYEPDLIEGQTYRYRVQALDACDELIIEDTVLVNTGDGPTPMQAQVERLVIGSTVYSRNTAELSWNRVAGAAEYSILDNGAFVQRTDGRSLFIDDLIPGVDRRFTVTALDADGNLIDQTTRVLNTADNSFALNRQPFLSGVITSYDSFRFRYGRVEMRARMPAGRGLWSAFWLLNAYYNEDQPADPEIDIIEAIGDRQTTANHAYHYRAAVGGNAQNLQQISSEFRTPIADFSADFHTYAVEWLPQSIRWFVDDVEVHRLEGEQVSSEQMYIIANLAVGGTFPGSPDDTTPFPARFEIDYIRAWQR